MPLLHACIKESMRLRPISVGVGRYTSHEMVIGGYTIPTDTMMITMNQVLCQQDKYFPGAHVFRPDRWLKGTKHTRFVWLPFGHGTRMCLGRRIAELEMNIALCKLIMNFKIEYHHEPIQTKTCLINIPDRSMKFKLIDLK